MKPGKYTIRELFVNREVEQIIIPEIQRDYVWKKEQVEGLLTSMHNDYEKFTKEEINVTADNDEIKKLFVNYYKKQQFASNIGFIYAYNDAEYKGKYFLIDGQQRVTTVYLLLLNLFISTDEKEDFKNKYFKDKQLKIDFKVRESSHDFFKNFIGFCLDQDFTAVDDFETVFSKALFSQYWYFDDYKNDKTIQSIICNYVTLNSFVEKNKLQSKDFLNYILDYVDCWYFDTNISEQGEELYIYMNARGEQIQNNENIKADLLGALKDIDVAQISNREDFTEEKSLAGIKKYWGKKWEEWQDFFWVNKGSNVNADDGFNEFLKCIAGLEQYLVKIENPTRTFKSIYEQLDLKIIEKYINIFIEIIKNKETFTKNYNYSSWLDQCISRIWELFNEEKNDWFIDYGDDKKATDLNRMAFIWPIFYYKNLQENAQNIDETYRVLRVFYVRLNNNIRAVKSIKGLVKYIVKNGIWNEKMQASIVELDLQSNEDEEEAKNVKTFLKEELVKNNFLKNVIPDQVRQFEELIWEIEDHPINLNGRNLKNQNITHLVDLYISLSLQDLLSTKDKFYQLFPLKKGDEGYSYSTLLQTILLYYGKYHHKVNPDYLDNYDFSNWRRIVRNIDGDAFDKFFKDFKNSNFLLSEILKEKEKEFCEGNNQTIKTTSDLYNKIMLYSIILKDAIWKDAGRIAVRNWEHQDGLFNDTANIYKLQKNFKSYHQILWTLVPTEIKNSINEFTLISELYNKILPHE